MEVGPKVIDIGALCQGPRPKVIHSNRTTLLSVQGGLAPDGRVITPVLCRALRIGAPPPSRMDAPLQGI